MRGRRRQIGERKTTSNSEINFCERSQKGSKRYIRRRLISMRNCSWVYLCATAYKLAPIKAMIIIIGEFIKQLSSLLLIRDHKTMQHTHLDMAYWWILCGRGLYKELLLLSISRSRTTTTGLLLRTRLQRNAKNKSVSSNDDRGWTAECENI